jgi:hypothetical protein
MLQLRQEKKHDQQDDYNGKHVCETVCAPDAGNHCMTKETEQPIQGQGQDE